MGKKRRLKNQIEKILDESRSDEVKVIVQLATNASWDSMFNETLKAAERTIDYRSMAISARDVSPAPASAFRALMKNQSTTSSRLEFRKSKLSFASQLNSTADWEQLAKQVTRKALVGSQRKNAVALSKSAEVGKAINRAAAKRKKQKKPPIAGGGHLWSSAAVQFQMKRDELNSFADSTAAVEGIVGVFPNRVVQSPPVSKVQSLPANVADNKTSAWGVNAIGALGAWGAYGFYGNDVKVAVLDTGVDPTHPDLIRHDGTSKVVGWAEFDEDGTPNPNSAPHDSGEHDTHVSGTIAGSADSGRYIGVAPDAAILGGLVLPNGGGSAFQVLAGIDWAINSGADVINMSLGGLGFDQDVYDLYTTAFMNANLAGIPVVVSVGNDGSQTASTPGDSIFSYAVGATDITDRAAGFSGGRTVVAENRLFSNAPRTLVYSKPDVAAPSVTVQSAVPGGRWEAWNGTSMAAPHAAGAFALLLSGTNIRSTVPLNQRAFVLRDLLTSTVEELGEAGQDHRFGYGRIDVLRAMGLAEENGYT